MQRKGPGPCLQLLFLSTYLNHRLRGQNTYVLMDVGLNLEQSLSKWENKFCLEEYSVLTRDIKSSWNILWFKSLPSLKVEFEFGILEGAFLKGKILPYFSRPAIWCYVQSCPSVLKWSIAEAAHLSGVKIRLQPVLHPSSRTCQHRSRATLLAEHALARHSRWPSGSLSARCPPWKAAYFTFVPGDTSR